MLYRKNNEKEFEEIQIAINIELENKLPTGQRTWLQEMVKGYAPDKIPVEILAWLTKYVVLNILDPHTQHWHDRSPNTSLKFAEIMWEYYSIL